MKYKAKELTKLTEDRNARVAAKNAKLDKIAEELKKAKAKAKEAAAEYDAAKNALDAVALINAKTKATAAADVVAVFEDTLKAEKEKALYTAEEQKRARDEIEDIRASIEDAANYAICEKLAAIEHIIENTRGELDKLADVKKDISNDGVTSIGAGSLVKNVSGTIYHTKSFFKEYWPSGKEVKSK